MAGCAIQPSALYKVEKGDPPRRITVDELVALATVFELEVSDLLRPLADILSAEFADANRRAEQGFDDLNATIKASVNARLDYLELVRKAHDSGDMDLLAALEAAEADESERNAARFARGGGAAGFVARLREYGEVRTGWTEQEFAEFSAVTDAADELFQAIISVTSRTPWLQGSWQRTVE
jgi:hypothetical protein